MAAEVVEAGRYRGVLMYRFLLRPAWIGFHLLVLTGIVTMVFLGFWQLDRLDQRHEFNTRVRERASAEPVPLQSVLNDIATGALTPASAEWLPVVVDGTYLDGQVVEFNVSQGGRAGENVLTALALDDPATNGDSTVIVNRGFIILGSDVPDAPATAVTVRGFVRPSEQRQRGELTDADDGAVLSEIRRIDLDRLGEQFSGQMAPVFVQLTGGEPAPGTGDPAPVVLPQLDNGPHLSYAVQWFVFSAAVALGWVLAVRRSLGQRRRDLAVTASVSSEADEGRPRPDGDASTTDTE